MAKLVIVVEVQRDPTDTDPHEVAADILTPYEDHCSDIGKDSDVEFVDAQWLKGVPTLEPIFDG